jgi:hypothetical protein
VSPDPYEELAGLPPVQLGALVERNAVELRAREARSLLLAAAWADAHEPPVGSPYGPLVERACQLGGEGTPEVAEFCVGEFAALQGLSFSVGRAMIADALDLRHRLARLWIQAKAGQVRAWKAQKIAQATRVLSADAAADVDSAIGGLVESVPWPRFEKVLSAAVLDADPALAAERAERARTTKRVWASAAEDGLKTLVAKADAGDVTWFMAAVNRIADILADDGDHDPVGARRAKAVGLLARPAEALALLAAHRDDPDPGPRGEASTAPDQPPLADPDLLDDLLDEEDPADPQAGPGEAEQPKADASVETCPNEPLTDEPPTTDEPGLPPDPQAAAEQAHTSLQVSSPFGPIDLKPIDLKPIDLKKARPRVVLYFHISETSIRDGGGLVRPEHGDPLTLIQLRDWLGETGCPVQVRPIRVPADIEPVDGYEIPTRVREAVRLREIADVWPFGTCTSRAMDLDHTQRYVPPDDGGPPGQTGPDALGPLGRSVHRAATFGRWGKAQPSPGLYVWRSPHGWVYLVTNQGTLALGRTAYAAAVWQAASRS